MVEKKLKVHMHLFSFDDNLFAYDYIKNILIRVDPCTYSMLEKILSEKNYTVSTDVTHNTQLNLFAKLGCFFYSEDFVEEKSPEVPLRTAYISFPTAHHCNLRCKYCFAKHGTNYTGKDKILTKFLVKDILEFVYYDCFKEYERIRLDFVSGGEPLLNFDLVKETVKISENLYERTRKPLDIFLCTNGTINNSDIWQYINTHNINLGISLDGPQNIHNIARVYENGIGCYSDTIDTIKHILNSPDYSVHTKSMWILSVITGKTQNLLDIIEHNKELGIKSMQMKLVRLDKDNELAIKEDSISEILKMYKKLTEHFVEAATEHDYTDLSMILNENDYFGKLIYHILYGGRMKRCYAGDRKLSFDGNGNIYPCDSFVGNEEFVLGNIYSGTNENVRKKFVDGTIFMRKKCQSCWARYICAGDCYYNSYLVNNNIYEPDSIFCTIIRHLAEDALYLYHVIKSNGDLEKLQNIVRIKRRFNI